MTLKHQVARRHSDKIQVKAFQAVFASSEGSPEDRFMRAVVLTSDDEWRQIQGRPGFRSHLARLLRLMRRKSNRRTKKTEKTI
ncbi:MAG TPA: hypothetical protein VMW24_09985 [Sedimentisphaerales bacterium]|nr:hypothetical protein [Sedimentisphaerales bacterium]